MGLIPFTAEAFAAALSKSGGEVTPDSAGTGQIGYIRSYVQDLIGPDSGSMFIEDRYIDADYLDDYTAFYARCFADYGRWCSRIHFFRCCASKELSHALVSGGTDEQNSTLRANYLGFVVVRPLPDALIGRTVLKTRDSADHFYPVTKDYGVNLCGLSLSVRGIAFQAQDTVLAACATIALWTAFHKTADLFRTATPTPAAITRSASQGKHGRPIPSKGLHPEEIYTAIRQVGLEPEVVMPTTGNRAHIGPLIYGYLMMGIPVLLIAKIGETEHVMTVVGFSSKSGSGESATSVPERIIDKLFCHDDQVGPYAAVQLSDGSLSSPEQIVDVSTDWVDAHGSPLPGQLISVVVPLYAKIRLRYLAVLEQLVIVKEILYPLLQIQTATWSLYLVPSNQYKEDVRNRDLDVNLKRSILEAPHPRFWWYCSLKEGTQPLMEMLFDATGVERPFSLTEVVWLSPDFAQAVQDTLLTNAVREVGMERWGDLFRALESSLVRRQQPFSTGQPADG